VNDRPYVSDPNTWSVDSEYGVLREVLLGHPGHFAWRPLSPVVRRTMANLEKIGIRFDSELACRQHQGLAEAYESFGVRVRRIPADPELPYNMSARDSSAMTPWGPLICSLQPVWRRREYTSVYRFYTEAGAPIWRAVSAGHFEGGDLVIVEPGHVLLGYSGERSEQAGAEQVAGWFRENGWEATLVPIPVHFVHLDVLIGIIGPKLAAIATECLEDYVVDYLEGLGFELIDVGYRDAIHLGCNVMALGRDRVISLAHNEKLNAQLRARGLDVAAPDFTMFTYGGGGVHCFSQPLYRDPA
jgi:N-dimethylarginine dimethylaminohydrolase